MPPSQMTFICPDCSAEFSRKDHAKRHKLSHQQPGFACTFANCGLLFHRRDVLRRHEAVHNPENAGRRRRPRRGPVPIVLPRSGGQRSLPAPASHDADPVLAGTSSSAGDLSDTDVSDDHQQQGHSTSSDSVPVVYQCQCQVDKGTVCRFCCTELIQLSDGRISPEWRGIISSSLTHYIQSQLKWFPFIRSTVLREDWVRSGRAFILAALGCRGIKQYHNLSIILWSEAVWRVKERVTWAVPGPDILYNFQTKILLVEYLQWSEDIHNPTWARPMLDEMTHKEARDLMNMLHDVTSEYAADRSIENELRVEEIRWTLWKFYCIMTRAILLGIKLDPPQLFQVLTLPGDSNDILALSQCAGKGSAELVGGMRGEGHSLGKTLPQVLSSLLADDSTRTSLPNTLSWVSKEIVLHAILYLSEHMVENTGGAEVMRQYMVGWHVETHERVHLLLMRWRQCFFIPPEAFWKAPFPEFAILQGTMFNIYLGARICQKTRYLGDDKRERWNYQYTKHAMRGVTSMHINMKHNNLTEIAAGGRWYLDGATWRSGCLTARYIMDWFQERAIFGVTDDEIDIIQTLESSMAFHLPRTNYYEVSYSPRRLSQLEWSIQDLWTSILCSDVWLDKKFDRNTAM